jgi:antitoxin (DNA-binding transcriptional repressor) of toxin-antitoxin stability system
MDLRTTVTEVARNFGEYVNRVAFGRESFVLIRGRKPVAELRPVPVGKRLGELPAMLGSLPRLSEEEAAALAEDLDLARRELEGVPLKDPWAS